MTNGETPTPEDIAARVDLGSAEYHDTCCSWVMWCADESLFTCQQECDCGGPEMAKAYSELTYDCLKDILDPWVHFIADDNLPSFRAATPEELADRIRRLLGIIR